jgi:molecular chaperone GrpE
MSKSHEKAHGAPHEKKQDVKSKLDIAMEKAESLGRAAGGAPPAPAAQAAVPAEELAALRDKAAKADEYYDRLLRTAADLENYRKRVERERADLLKFGQEEIMSDLIPVLDNFERALEAAGGAGDKAQLLEGVKLIRKQLLSVLRKYGLEQIESLAQPFNPERHEAVAELPSDDHAHGTVVAEHLKGYTLNGRLLRPSAVTVSRAPGDEEPPEAEPSPDGEDTSE